MVELASDPFPGEHSSQHRDTIMINNSTSTGLAHFTATEFASMAAYVVERINDKVVSLNKKAGGAAQIRRASSFASLAPTIMGAMGGMSSSCHHHQTHSAPIAHHQHHQHRITTITITSINHHQHQPSPSSMTHHCASEQEQEWWDEQRSGGPATALGTLGISRACAHTAPAKKNQLLRKCDSCVCAGVMV